MSTHDLDEDDHYRTHRQDALRLGPEIASTFHTVETILEAAESSLYIVDDTLFLKLLPATFDIDVIVQTQRLASRAVPVPRVRRYGRSGNCAYILSDYVAGDGFYDVMRLAKTVPVWIIAARLEKSVFREVEPLRLLEISHNDLHYNNIIMDRYWRIAAIIDWDVAWQKLSEAEYEYRSQDSRTHEWDWMFLRSTPFGAGFCYSPVDGNVLRYTPYALHIAGSCSQKSQGNLYEHTLDPLVDVLHIAPPEPSVVLLTGGDGHDALSYVDEGTGRNTIAGIQLSRVFTSHTASPLLRQRAIPTTSLDDVLPIPLAYERGWDYEFAHLVVRECANIVVLVNWGLPVHPTLLEGLSLPMNLADDSTIPLIFRVDSADKGCRIKITRLHASGFEEPHSEDMSAITLRATRPKRPWISKQSLSGISWLHMYSIYGSWLPWNRFNHHAHYSHESSVQTALIICCTAMTPTGS